MMSVNLDGFHRVCSVNDLEERKGKRFILSDTEIAIFLVNKKIYALSNICPHQHSALIYDGFLEDEFVVCPAHGWKFNLKTGNTPHGGRGLQTYETKLVGNDVFVKIGEKKFSW